MAVDALGVRTSGSWLRRLRTSNPFHWALLVLMALLVGLPAVFLITGQSFPVPDSHGYCPSPSQLNFENYGDVWWDPSTYALFYNTFIYVFGATAAGITLAATTAWLVEHVPISPARSGFTPACL